MKINEKNDGARQVALRLDSLTRNYPQMRCYLYHAGYNDLLMKMKTLTATPEESLKFIERAMDAAMLCYENCNNKEYVSKVLRDTGNWMAVHHGIVKMSPEFSLLVNTNCDEVLTA